MKLGIMQPYFFPYLGYWQLLNAVDQYVIYDDVNFVKGGWINRNRILVQGAPQYLNLQMQGASPYKKILDLGVNPSPVWKEKVLATLTMAYKRAPYYDEVFPILKETILCQELRLSTYVINSIRAVCGYLQIDTKLLLSSEMDQDRSLRGQDRVLDISKRLGANHYCNAIGGQELYSKEIFHKDGIELHFVKTHFVVYQQFKNEFVPGLSIIDVMMFNSPKEIQAMLEDYELL